MWIPKIYTVVLIGVLSAFSSNLFAQTSNADVDFNNWLQPINAFEESIQQSISSLKLAEASIKDSVTAAQLERLGYLAVAQSGFTTSQSDKYQRAGYWMLSFPIAIKYGLIINCTIDERNDIEKSTQVAFHYWESLSTNYGYDSLADIVFTQSPIAISKYAYDSVNHRVGYDDLIASRKRLIMVKEVYVKSMNKITVGPIEATVLVKSTKPISFEAIHHYLQISTVKLTSLNPQWISNVYNPQYGLLKLPLNYKDLFTENIEEMEQRTRDDEVVLAAANNKRLAQLKGNIPDLRTYKPIRYKIKMGDNLGRIAQRYHVKISSIRSWNDLKNDRIYAGQRITIYVPINQKEEVVKASPKKTKKTKNNLLVGEYNQYTVKTGDTLWAISQQFNDVTADMIMEDNGINANISPGQVLKIRKTE